MTKHEQPPNDPSSAPESGTIRESTTGNNNSPPDRAEKDLSPASITHGRPVGNGDDPSVAGEER